MKKVTILALHLGVGGTENAIISLGNMLSERYEVEIICNYKLQENTAFKINPNVKVTFLMSTLKPNREELKQAIKKFNIFQIIKQGYISLKVLYLRKKLMVQAIKKLDSDVIITTRYFHNAWSGKYAKPGTLKIAQEHNHHNNNKKYINKTLRCIKNIDYFLPVSQELTDFYKSKLQNSKTKCLYIPHSIDNFPEEVSNLQEKNIISVGRLAKEKGYLDLIDIFKIVHQNNPDWVLNIVGDGIEKDAIENKIKENNLENSIILHGFKNKDELNELYKNSSIYVMTSYTESFGIALVEAESFGLPILAFDSAQGAKEIIKDEANGYLIQNRNISEMADKIDNLINDEELRQKLGAKGRELSQNYKKENVASKWFDLIENNS